MPQTTLKYDLEVKEDGHVEVRVPFRPGTHITVFVVKKQNDSFDDLMIAAQSSIDFWDNPYDDEDWNDA